MSDPVAEQNSQNTADAKSEGAATAAETPSEEQTAQAARDAETEPPKDGSPEPVNPAGSRAPNKVVEWFWLGDAMRRVHARGSTLTPRGRELLRRARLAAEVGSRTLEPPDPFPSGAADAIACELYRESIEWSLAAHQQQGVTPSATPKLAATADLRTLLDEAKPEFLAKAAGDEAALANLRKHLEGKGYRDFAELDSSAQTRVARDLRLFAEALTTSLDKTQNELDKLWLKRLLRIGLFVAALGALVFFLNSMSLGESSADLTADAEWTASSYYGPEPGCKSPAQECAESPNFFIATEEQDEPWLLFDLKTSKKISGVRVENRIDCCQDRAIPLVVEVSDDNKKWKEVARRTTDFQSWKENFDTVEARYVRLRILKRTNLNLSRVRILP